MATTTYTVFANDVALEGTKSKKSTAVDLARKTRDEQKVAVRVETNAGTVVFEAAAPKKIKMSKPYTRVVDGVEAPEGLRVAYVRARKGVALVHNPEAEKDEQYAFMSIASGELLDDRFATTREAGKAFVALPTPAPASA